MEKSWRNGAHKGEKSAKYLKLLALPREAGKANQIRRLRNRLGRKGIIVLQGLLRARPKRLGELSRRRKGAVELRMGELGEPSGSSGSTRWNATAFPHTNRIYDISSSPPPDLSGPGPTPGHEASISTAPYSQPALPRAVAGGITARMAARAEVEQTFHAICEIGDGRRSPHRRPRAAVLQGPR